VLLACELWESGTLIFRKDYNTKAKSDQSGSEGRARDTLAPLVS